MHYKIIKRGAEADIFLTTWYENKAISKLRTSKKYRHTLLDNIIRRQRTLHEASMLHAAKKAGIKAPFIHFIDHMRAEIIMEYIPGNNVKSILSKEIAIEMGKYTSILHNNHIIHGDLTTSNFIKYGNHLYLVDYGLSYYSNRIEDMATDIRLIKEILSSAYVPIFEETYQCFLDGYLDYTKNNFNQILNGVKNIEKRGRYARIF